jgi:ketosteroid isomerase-like protein
MTPMHSVVAAEEPATVRSPGGEAQVRQSAQPSADVASGVNAVFEEVAQLIATADKSADLGLLANAVADAMYDDQVQILGEGLTSVVSGRAACIEQLKLVLADLGPGSRLAFHVHQPYYSDERLASMLVQIESRTAQEPATVKTYRALYTFERGTRGWRVVLEYFGVGTI